MFSLLEETIVPALPKPVSLNPKKIDNWDGYLVSLIHASVVSVGSVLALYWNPQFFTDPFEYTNSFASAVIMYSFGYFMGDLVRMIHADDVYLSKLVSFINVAMCRIVKAAKFGYYVLL